MVPGPHILRKRGRLQKAKSPALDARFPYATVDR